MISVYFFFAPAIIKVVEYIVVPVVVLNSRYESHRFPLSLSHLEANWLPGSTHGCIVYIQVNASHTITTAHTLNYSLNPECTAATPPVKLV